MSILSPSGKNWSVWMDGPILSWRGGEFEPLAVHTARGSCCNQPLECFWFCDKEDGKGLFQLPTALNPNRAWPDLPANSCHHILLSILSQEVVTPSFLLDIPSHVWFCSIS